MLGDSTDPLNSFSHCAPTAPSPTRWSHDSVTDIRDPYEVQTHLAPYASGTFDDFNEMVIQFGNLTPLPGIAEKSHA